MIEEDIRPRKIFEDFLILAERDIYTYFYDVPYFLTPCPACGSTRHQHLFRKGLFDYVECIECGTLYVNPRPESDAFSNYYNNAPSMHYFASHFYKETEEIRRKLLIKPKALSVRDHICTYYGPLSDGDMIIDIGAGYGNFCEELKHLLPEINPVIAVEPSEKLQESLKKKGIATVPRFFEEVEKQDFGGGRIAVATCFELLDHIHDPNVFLSKCYQILDPGALFIFTMLTWDGFDLQQLREHSQSITPPQHINFFTKRSISLFLEKHGFDICQISTPGKLDADIVANNISHVHDPFLREMLAGDLQVREAFQKFLQDAKLSSHMMVIAKKKTDIG